MARRHLDNRRFRAFIPRIVFRARCAHDTPTCGKSASGRKILRVRGRPTSRPVERREAQRPFSGLRNPVGSDAAPRERASQPRSSGAFPEPRQLRQGVSQAPGASRRSILVQNGKWERAAPRPLNSRGGEALATFTPHRRVLICVTVFPGRSAAPKARSRASFDALWRSEVVRCRPGTFTHSESATIPDQRCITACCTASGKPAWR
jgi:hypothetical protein